MNRRIFLKSLTVLSIVLTGCARFLKAAAKRALPSSGRVRPGDPLWPSEQAWAALRGMLRGDLIKVVSPLSSCVSAPQGASCMQIFSALENPYFIRDHPALTQTLGWVDAWTSAPSVYAVAAEQTGDVVAAVNFAREHNVRLVVKGGGHSYQGTSSSADSLLIWLRHMDSVLILRAFVPAGSDGRTAPRPAVSIGAGAVWGQVYDTVTTRGGKYVQGGGCATVGVAGLIQSGGFGSFSKRYGMAAGSLLEAEVVTADGTARIANAFTNPDLFWALKGGGGGSFGVVTRVTLRTHELPEFFGGAFGSIRAKSDNAFRALVTEMLRFYADRLFNAHWGEQIRFGDKTLDIQMVFQGLDKAQAEEAWRPFMEWVAKAGTDLEWLAPLSIINLPARNMWDAAFLKNIPGLIFRDDRAGAADNSFYWAADRKQAGQFLHGYRSAWLSESMLTSRARAVLADALIAAGRIWRVSLHFNKGLAGASPDALTEAADTAINPAARQAFALAIVAGEGPPSFPGIIGHEPDVLSARRSAAGIDRAMEQILRVAPHAGSYVSESDFFERAWQRSFWGGNYDRLLEIKRRYDPHGLFIVHHGVGSEEWSPDGFTPAS